MSRRPAALPRRLAAVALSLCLSIAVARSAATDTPAATAGLSFLVGGTQVHETDHGRWTGALLEAGLNTVAVTVYARQGEWDSNALTFEAEDPAVLDEIRAAKSRGLSVVLVLRVALDHSHARNKFIWHGMIMPGSREAIRSWFENYTRFVLTWAWIAEAEGVDVLGVGSELNALNETLPITRRGNLKNYYGSYWYQRLSRRRARKFADEIEPRHLWVRGFENYQTLDEYLDARFEHNVAWARKAYLRSGPHTLRRINARRRAINDEWVGLIGETRKVYGGLLTYAANFDSYQNVGFWPWLDMIGINAYFSLLPTVDEQLTPEARHERFVAAWEGILGRVAEFKTGQGLAEMPFLFTEIGYTFRRHSTVEPWAHGGFSVVGWKGHARRLVVWGDQPVDYEERRQALAALLEVHRAGASHLRGILYWKLSTNPAHEAIEPFVVLVGPDTGDGTQEVLRRFGDGSGKGALDAD